MRRRTGIRLAMVVCFVILASVVRTGVSGIFHAAGFSYKDEKKYTAGGTELTSPVKNLDINWISGKITFTYHSGKEIRISETSKKKIKPDMEMRWWLDGDTLRIQYAKAGFHQLFMNQEKELTIDLPQDISFDAVDIDCTSGDIVVPSLNAETLNLDVTSGDIDVTGESKKVDIDSTSGDVTISLKAFDSLEIDSTSGDVTLALPEKPGFTVDVDVISGDFDYDLPLTAKGDSYTCGDGSKKVEISTTSGDVYIKALQ